jgi:hypothetical protein
MLLVTRVTRVLYRLTAAAGCSLVKDLRRCRARSAEKYVKFKTVLSCSLLNHFSGRSRTETALAYLSSLE